MRSGFWLIINYFFGFTNNTYLDVDNDDNVNSDRGKIVMHILVTCVRKMLLVANMFRYKGAAFRAHSGKKFLKEPIFGSNKLTPC